MDRFIIFCVGAGAAVISEIFWKGTSRRSVVLWGGSGMLLLRRIILRFPFASRALLCIFGALPMLALRYVILISLRLTYSKREHIPCRLTIELPSFSYGLYRFLLIAPAYTIIEYLEGRFGM